MTAIQNLVRRNIRELKSFLPADDVRCKGIFLDLNENNYGTVIDEFEDLQLNRFPDPHQNELRNIVGKFYSLPAKNLFFGTGTYEIVDLLIGIFCEPEKDSAMIMEPTAGFYNAACKINSVDINTVLLDDYFQIDFSELNKAYTNNTKLIFICSPNNPTGNLINKKDILHLCKNYNSVIVVDESYIDFTEDKTLIRDIHSFENLIVLRSFSHAWGLAGLQLAFCVAHQEIISYLFKVKNRYNINTIVNGIIRTLFRHYERRNIFICKIIKERKRISEELKSIAGINKVYPSDANFILFNCNNSEIVKNQLVITGLFVSDQSHLPNLENCLRVSIGTEEENNLFLESLKKILINR